MVLAHSEIHVAVKHDEVDTWKGVHDIFNEKMRTYLDQYDIFCK